MSEKRNALLDSVKATYSLGLALIERKNHDYGANDDAFANFRTAGVLGVSVEKGILIRTLDKISRINSLLEHPAYVTEESMEDTITDAINYLAILKAYREIERNGSAGGAIKLPASGERGSHGKAGSERQQGF